MSSPDVRLAELCASIALAGDAGAGLAPETSLRTALIALRLAEVLDWSAAEKRDVFYSALLRHIGCTASAHEETELLGDDLELKASLAFTDMANPLAAVRALVAGGPKDRSALGKAAVVARFVARGPRIAPVGFRGKCEVAIRFAVRLGFGAAVQRALDEAFERWDGKGLPRGLRGKGQSQAARAIAAAEVASLFFSAGGEAAACAVVAERAGGQLDPSIAKALGQNRSLVFAGMQAESPWEQLMAAEPRPHALIGRERMMVVAEVLADFADMKSPYTLGHSRGVSALCVAAASELGFDAERTEELRVAALLHDVGRIAVSNAIWDKRTALTTTERDRIREHTFATERILARARAFGPAAQLASLAHERVRGGGYHRGLSGGALALAARILAAADVAQALSEARPQRGAIAKPQAVELLRAMVSSGELDVRAVDAVLVASGVRAAGSKRVFPSGLSEREVEVLCLVARGLTDKEIAHTLGISHRTVHHHNQHAFGKIGVTTRGAAALFVVENALLHA